MHPSFLMVDLVFRRVSQVSTDNSMPLEASKLFSRGDNDWSLANADNSLGLGIPTFI